MIRILLCACFILTIFWTKAQSSKDRLRDIIDEEVEDVGFLNRTNHSGLYQFTPAQQVPAWFINPPVSDNQFIYSIGISDPGLDSVQGMNMALFRAEIMANVLCRSTTQLLCDFFLDEEQHVSNVVYENYSRIYAYMAYGIDPYEIVDEYYNEFDECIVLIKYNNENDKGVKQNKIELEVYKNETENSIYGNYESVYEMIIKEDSMNTDSPIKYQLTELGARNSIHSEYDSLSYDMPIYSLRYSNFTSSDTMPMQQFSHGLWKEFYKSFVTQIVANARTKPENVSVLLNKYQTESYQKLTRGISQNKMRFVLTGVKASNNQISVGLKEIPLVSE